MRAGKDRVRGGLPRKGVEFVPTGRDVEAVWGIAGCRRASLLVDGHAGGDIAWPVTLVLIVEAARRGLPVGVLLLGRHPALRSQLVDHTGH